MGVILVVGGLLVIVGIVFTVLSFITAGGDTSRWGMKAARRLGLKSYWDDMRRRDMPN